MMNSTNSVNEFEVYKRRAIHWRDAHFECARRYRRTDYYLLGIPSVVLATTIFGLSAYLTDRPSAPTWQQYALLLMALTQACISAVQAYLRPGALSETYRISGANFSDINRQWDVLIVKLRMGEKVSLEEISSVNAHASKVANDAPPVPHRILKKFGLPADSALNAGALAP